MPIQNFIQKLVSAILTITMFFSSLGWGLSPRQNFLRAPGGLAAAEETSNSLTKYELDEFLLSPGVQRFLTNSDHKEWLPQDIALLLKDLIKAQQIIPVLYKKNEIQDISKYLRDQKTKFKTALVIAFACSKRPTITTKKAAEFLDVNEKEIDNIRKWLILGEEGVGEITAKAKEVYETWQGLIAGTNQFTDIRIADKDKEKKEELIRNGKYLIAHFLLGNISMDETLELIGLSELAIKLIKNIIDKQKTGLPEITQWLREKLLERENLEEKFRSEKIKLPKVKIEEQLASIFEEYRNTLKKIDRQTKEYVEAIITHKKFQQDKFIQIREMIREEKDISNKELTAAILTLYLFGHLVDSRYVKNFSGLTAEKIRQIVIRVQVSQFSKNNRQNSEITDTEKVSFRSLAKEIFNKTGGEAKSFAYNRGKELYKLLRTEEFNLQSQKMLNLIKKIAEKNVYFNGKYSQDQDCAQETAIILTLIANGEIPKNKAANYLAGRYYRQTERSKAMKILAKIFPQLILSKEIKQTTKEIEELIVPIKKLPEVKDSERKANLSIISYLFSLFSLSINTQSAEGRLPLKPKIEQFSITSVKSL